MKNALVLVAALAAVALGTGLVMAETDVTITGQVRVRTEISDKSFNSTAKAQQYTYLRTRVMVDAAIGRVAHPLGSYPKSHGELVEP